jgi:hypothetical protein
VDIINCELLKKELDYLNQAFSLHLGDFMTDRIKLKLEMLFQQAESQTFPEFLSLSTHNILDIHLKNNEYSMMNLIVYEIFKNINLSKLL